MRVVMVANIRRIGVAAYGGLGVSVEGKTRGQVKEGARREGSQGRGEEEAIGDCM